MSKLKLFSSSGPAAAREDRVITESVSEGGVFSKCLGILVGVLRDGDRAVSSSLSE